MGLLCSFCHLTVLPCSSMSFPKAAVSSGNILVLLHHGLFHRPPGESLLCAYGISSPSFSHLGSLTAVSLVFPLFFSVVFSLLSYTCFLRYPCPGHGSAMPLRGRLDPAGAGCVRPGQAGLPSRSPQCSLGVWAPATRTGSMISAENTSVHLNLWIKKSNN